jgi:hypothetical protein
MKTTFNERNRSYSDTFTLTGEPIEGGDLTPALKLTTYHLKDYKAFFAYVSYVELEDCGTYAVERWQSDWVNVRIEAEKVARYSEKALAEFRAKAVKRVLDGDFTTPALVELVDRIPATEVAA